MRIRLALVVMLAVAGCAPITAVSGKLALSEHELELQMPPGWYRIEAAGRHQLAAAGLPFAALLIDLDSDPVLLTRDGLELQAIRIERVPPDKELPHTKRKLARGMPAHDVAELELDNVRANPQALNFAVLETAPATVAGRSGFRLAYGWKTRKGLALRALHYGFVDGGALYRIVYQAPARHYFRRDLGTFEQIRETLRLAGAPAA